MKSPQDAELLRIFFGEKDRYQGKPLAEAVVEAARVSGLAGATVLKGLLGFGAHSHMHSAKILRISEDLPLIIEIVDQADKIENFLPQLDDMLQEGMVTIEKVRVYACRKADW
ncbi:DUF190 domain-containing protein [bacterium]|nr:DUF190 domain-containing protein [bacterium]